MLLLSLLGCKWAGSLASGTEGVPVTGYDVEWSIDPEVPVAGSPAELGYSVVDQLGRPIEDLQSNHQRLVHVNLISRDLASFQHLHHEDFADLTADDLREATFHFPVTFPAAGETLVVFDFAHQNVYQEAKGWISVDGEPAQLDAPRCDDATEVDVDGVHAELVWDIAPVAGYESAFRLVLSDDAGDVEDVAQWLGADGHAVIASEDLSVVGHTHAWYPGMENVAVGHDMEHVYGGPDLPFHYTFADGGSYRMWVQFAREDAPDSPITAPFCFEVGV